VRLALACLAALVLASTAAAAPVKTKTASSGSVRATVSWQPVKYFIAKDVRLSIVRGGRTWRSAKLGPSTPWAIKARDLDGDGEPEVLVDFYTGGAHCCLFTRIFRHTPSGYVAFRHLWGDPSYRLRDLARDGSPELVSADDHFAYAFTSYAGSALPVQVWRYRAGRLVDVTRSFPAVVRKDAATWWKAYEDERSTVDSDPRGVLAAWMADQYLLGQEDAGWATLAQINADGELVGDTIWPAGDAYLAKLRKFLTAHGYAGKD
jgi:hypothetical protein